MIARNLRWLLYFMAAILVLVTACDRSPQIHEDKLDILGTFAQISIVGMTPEAADAAARAVEADLRKLDTIGFTVAQQGELQRLNESLASGQAMEVSDEMLELLQEAQRLSAASQGLFNPAAGALIALWEFTCDSKECDESHYSDEVQRLVSREMADVIRSHPSMQDLVIKGKRVRSRNRHVKLEFGDIIRGFAMDKGIAHLKQKAVENAMINIGGNTHAIGTRGDHAWWAGIPDQTGKHHVGFIETGDDEAVFTVRALDRSFGKQGQIYRHVVDPRTGLPVEHIKSVTVVHESAMTANAAASAFMIADMKDWKSIADSMNVHSFLMITGDGTMYTSPAIDHRIHWNQGVTHRHLVP